MKGENILHLNIPNVITVGIILLIWAAVWAVVGQSVRKALGIKATKNAGNAGLTAAGVPTMAA